MTVLYPNLCYREVCYKGTALYMVLYRGLHCIYGKVLKKGCL